MGPEASVFIFAVIAALFVGIDRRFGKRSPVDRGQIAEP